MVRTILAAAAALALVAPASAQTARELSGDAWSCKMVSLVGDPGGDMTLAFKRNGVLEGEFYMEVPTEGVVVSMRFSITGDWTLNAPNITMSVNDGELLGAWLDGKELPDETKDTLSDTLSEELGTISGDSTVAYIARHAMVLEEEDTSMSCWR